MGSRGEQGRCVSSPRHRGEFQEGICGAPSLLRLDFRKETRPEFLKGLGRSDPGRVALIILGRVCAARKIAQPSQDRQLAQATVQQPRNRILATL